MEIKNRFYFVLILFWGVRAFPGFKISTEIAFFWYIGAPQYINNSPGILSDAVFLLTVGSFLLTVELFLLTVDNFSFFTYSWSFLLTILAFLLTVGAFLLTVKLPTGPNFIHPHPPTPGKTPPGVGGV